MSRRRIHVINPNSNERVTEGLREALAGWAAHPAIAVECVTLQDGPFGIESDADIEAVAPRLLDECRRRADCAAHVIACYSDPGLAACRDAVSQPVFGMQQSAVATAVAMGRRFGVLALSEASIARHLQYIDTLGLRSWLAGELPLNLSVDDAARHPDALQRIIDSGRRLIDEQGAGALILGCAGMARHREPAMQALGVPVIEPVQAAVTLAAGSLL